MLKQNSASFSALSKEDYQGSDVSVMITNEMYEESRDISLVATSLTAGVAEKVLLPPRDSGVGSVLDSGDDVPFPGVNMSQRARMPLPPEAFGDDDDQGAVGGAWTYSEEGDYTEIDDVLDQTNEPENDPDLYTDINDVKREKIEQRVRRDSGKREKSTRNTAAF
ncbi:uncharacterized protein [Littorina saxatilis]|uniref:uncharacterized protein isoform X2 n=1 Tax=Littorina saxatilis TaxID=31220 RepID=UPI0038B47194